MAAVAKLAGDLGVASACRVLTFPRATWYRRRRPKAVPRRTAQKRALVPAERRRVLDVLESERFVDTAPPAVHATLLDEGTWLCSVRTMYRLLAAGGPVR